MGRHSDSDSDREDERHAKKARKEGERKSSKSHKSKSKSSKKESRKEGKKERKKSSSKGERKHRSKSDKAERKRKRSRSSSSTDDDSSDSSRSPSPSSGRKPSHSSSAAAAAPAAAPAIPPPSASSVARCLSLIDTLLQHGGGDRAESLQQLQFMLFKLDSGSSVDVSAIPDPLVKHILSTMLRELGCTVRRDPETNEQGFMAPVDARNRPAYKLLTLLDAAFNPPKKPAAAEAPQPQVIGPIGPSMPPAASSAAASVAAASSTGATATAAPRMLGPAMPQPEDFERLAAGDAPAAETAADAADDDDAGNFGPKMPSQMTPQELSAFERLRASREHLSAVKHMESTAGERARAEGGREEWMMALPTASASSMPTSAMLVNLAASGDREALKGRGFSAKGVTRVEQDDEWALSPADKARREAEKAAVRQAEQAVYNSSRAINGDLSDMLGGARGKQSANSSAAAAQAANDRMMARYKQAHAATAESLVAAHARAAEEAAKSAKAAAGGLFRWDREKEMGMRGVKGPAALKKEMQSAFTLNDNFAPAGS